MKKVIYVASPLRGDIEFNTSVAKRLARKLIVESGDLLIPFVPHLHFTQFLNDGDEVDRGVVLAWHDPATTYDGPQTFVVVQQRSPLLDYDYSPIGKLIDEASLAPLDRIFAGDTWRDDVRSAVPTDGERDVADFLQVPVKIVKVLVYEGGNLVQAETPAPTKATVEAAEATLDGLKPDAYLTEPPERPKAPSAGRSFI